MPPVVVVTGANRGIGLAVARILLDLDTLVVAICRARSPELDALACGSLLVVQCDITNATAVDAALSTAVKTFRAIDAVVLNAGVLGPLARVASPASDLDAWRACFDVNVFAQVTLLRAATPYLSTSSNTGRVVFVSSGAAVGNTAGWAAYNASKAAFNAICRTYANEQPNIVAVALRPGMVDTDMQAHLRTEGSAAMASAELARFVDAHRGGKLVRPEDCGHVIAALALRAPRDLSGCFLAWDSDECAPFRKQ